MNEMELDLSQVVNKLSMDVAGLVQQVAMLDVMNKQLQEENKALRLECEGNEPNQK